MSRPSEHPTEAYHLSLAQSTHLDATTPVSSILDQRRSRRTGLGPLLSLPLPLRTGGAAAAAVLLRACLLLQQGQRYALLLSWPEAAAPAAGIDNIRL